MQYRPLGRTGVQVSPLCLGAMMFGPWGNDDRADSIRIIHSALEAGINFIDTADVYSAGVSEEIVGEALHGRPDRQAPPQRLARQLTGRNRRQRVTARCRRIHDERVTASLTSRLAN